MFRSKWTGFEVPSLNDRHDKAFTIISLWFTASCRLLNNHVRSTLIIPSGCVGVYVLLFYFAVANEEQSSSTMGPWATGDSLASCLRCCRTLGICREHAPFLLPQPEKKQPTATANISSSVIRNEQQQQQQQ